MEETVVKVAQKISNGITGSKTCDIQLLQKYHMVINAEKCYPALTGLRFHDTIGKNNIKKNDIAADVENWFYLLSLYRKI